MPIRFLNTVDLTVTSSILKTDANGVIVAAVAGTDYINTVTSAMVTTALGYTPVPTTRTLTINGTAFDLSANRTWTITTITGNAGSATVLQTARTINGTSFNGSADITTANWGTARTITIGNTGKSVNGSANVTWTLAEIGASQVYRSTINVAAAGTWTTIGTVVGSSLASAVRMTIQGTSGNVVINVQADILVNHYQDILLTTTSGFYTQLFIRIISNDNETYSIEVQPVSAAGATSCNVEVFPLNNETVTFGGSPVTPGMSFTMTTRQGVYTVGTGGNDGTISAGGDLYVAGNAGIGTTSPAYKLDVDGQIVSRNSTAGRLSTISGTRNINLQSFSGDWNYLRSNGANFVIGTEDASNLYFRTSDTARLTIDTTGNVGIGTTAPGAKLEVNAASSSPIVRIAGGGDGTGGGKGNIRSSDQGGTNYWDFGRDNLTTGNFVITPPSGNSSLSITIGGNVGIGTTSPASKLQVVGTAVLGEGLLNISNTYASGGVYFPAAKIRNTRGDHSYGIVSEFSVGAVSGVDRPSILFYADAASHSWQVGQVTSGWGSNDSFGIGYRANNLPNTFNTWPTNYFTITAAGNVGIGTTAPGAKLNIVHTASTSIPALQVASSASLANNDIVRFQVNGLTNGFRMFQDASSVLNYTFQDGRLGIGTTSPADRLHVYGGRIVIDNTLASQSAIQFNHAGTEMGVLYRPGGISTELRLFMTGAGDVMMWNSSGNVGVGTTTPSYKLDVSGSARVNSTSNLAMFVKTNSAFGAAISYEDSTTGGNDVISAGAIGGDFYISTNYSERMRITSGGNVGIGTTAPAQKLHVVGSRILVQDATNAGLMINTGGVNRYSVASTGSAFQIYDEANSTNRLYITSDGNIGIGTISPSLTATNRRILSVNGTSSSLIELKVGDLWKGYLYRDVNRMEIYDSSAIDLSTNGSIRATITSAGNVGIGTTAPSSKLDVQLSSYDGITLSRAAQSGGSYIQGRSYDTSNVFRTSARIALGAVAATNAADGFITFNTYSANTENERMRITSAGNVGIGTTSPTNQLTVTTATNAVDVVRLNNTGGDSGSVQGVTHLAINHFNSGTNPSTRITAYQDGVSGWPGGMYFSTRSLNTDSAPVERMRITSTGNVGIGTSSPNALYRTTITTGAGQTGALQTTGSVNINSGALAVGSITPSGTAGRIDASNDIVAFSTSDRRFKENITPISNALDKVKTLTGVEFDWKQETKDYHGYVGHDVGVIAQEVQAVLPEAVRTNHSGHLSVRYEKMIALLIEAMKEQQAQIDELKAKLDGLTK